MQTNPIKLTDVIYNAANQSFEACVTVYGETGARKYACAIEAAHYDVIRRRCQRPAHPSAAPPCQARRLAFANAPLCPATSRPAIPV